MDRNKRPKISISHATSLDGNIARKDGDLGLVDEVIISVIPVVLGSGIPLFSKIKDDKWCQLVSSRAFSNGLVQLHYEVVNN